MFFFLFFHETRIIKVLDAFMFVKGHFSEKKAAFVLLALFLKYNNISNKILRSRRVLKVGKLLIVIDKP